MMDMVVLLLVRGRRRGRGWGGRTTLAREGYDRRYLIGAIARQHARTAIHMECHGMHASLDVDGYPWDPPDMTTARQREPRWSTASE